MKWSFSDGVTAVLHWAINFAFSQIYFDGLVQDCSNSSANTLELLEPCTEPLIWYGRGLWLTAIEAPEQVNPNSHAQAMLDCTYIRGTSPKHEHDHRVTVWGRLALNSQKGGNHESCQLITGVPGYIRRLFDHWVTRIHNDMTTHNADITYPGTHPMQHQLYWRHIVICYEGHHFLVLYELIIQLLSNL